MARYEIGRHFSRHFLSCHPGEEGTFTLPVEGFTASFHRPGAAGGEEGKEADSQDQEEAMVGDGSDKEAKVGDHLRREHQVLETMEMDGGVAVHLTTARSQENLDIARWAGEWIGSSMATSHMVRVMAARTRSRRHLLFLDRRERERCSGAGPSRLYQLSNPGFLGGGGETDTAVIKHLTERVFLPNLEAADPELREIYARDDKCGFVYATCVLFPETFIHQHQVWSGPPGTSCCNHLRRCRARPGRRPRWPSWRWPWTPRRGWVLLVMW